MNVHPFAYNCPPCYPTYQIVHVSSGEHVRPHVGVLVKEGV